MQINTGNEPALDSSQQRIVSFPRLKAATGLLPAVILGALLCARWIRITGLGDFGNDYDMVSRLMQGQWQGRDFFSIFPFGAGYSLLLFEHFFGNHYFVVNVHLWLWWLINALAAGGVATVCGAPGARAAFSAVSVALLTVPPNTHTSAYAFIASAFSGLAVILLIRGLRTGGRWLAVLSGIFGGAVVFVKPNVGVALIASCLTVCALMALFQARNRSLLIAVSTCFFLGSIAGALAVLIVPGLHGGYGELLREIFSGGSEIKGGPFELLSRILPRVSTSITSPNRYLIEAALTAPIFVGLLAGFHCLFGRSSRDRASAGPEPLLLWLICAAAAGLSIFSLFPWELPHHLTRFFQAAGIVSLPFFLWQVLYLAALAALIASVAAGLRLGERLQSLTSPGWMSLLVLIWLCGVAASGRYNSIFAATLFIPAIALRMQNTAPERNFYRCAAGLLILWTLAWHVAPNWRSTFAHLTPLPQDSVFAGLYFPDGAPSPPNTYPLWSSSSMIEQCQRNIAPRVSGHSVLWLTPAVGAAFGGRIYRYGIDGLAPNNIPVWAEQRFGKSIRSSPPDFIVSPDLTIWDNPKWTFLRPEIMVPWLQENYAPVWTLGSQGPLTLWERKTL